MEAGPRGRKNGKGGHDLYPIIYVPRPIIVAQVRTILRLSIIGSDRRFSPSDPSVLRNNVVPLLLFPLTYFLLSAFSLLLFHGVQFLLACARCARIRGQERIEMSVFD